MDAVGGGDVAEPRQRRQHLGDFLLGGLGPPEFRRERLGVARAGRRGQRREHRGGLLHRAGRERRLLLGLAEIEGGCDLRAVLRRRLAPGTTRRGSRGRPCDPDAITLARAGRGCGPNAA